MPATMSVSIRSPIIAVVSDIPKLGVSASRRKPWGAKAAVKPGTVLSTKS